MTTPTSTTRGVRTLLSCTALTLAACIVLLIGRSTSPRVEAGMIASDDTFTLMTAPARSGTADGKSDLLHVTDNDNGVLLVYRATQAGASMKITLVDGGFIDQLFDAIRP